jgi:hypothetical protein
VETGSLFLKQTKMKYFIIMLLFGILFSIGLAIYGLYEQGCISTYGINEWQCPWNNSQIQKIQKTSPKLNETHLVKQPIQLGECLNCSNIECHDELIACINSAMCVQITDCADDCIHTSDTEVSKKRCLHKCFSTGETAHDRFMSVKYVECQNEKCGNQCNLTYIK